MVVDRKLRLPMMPVTLVIINLTPVPLMLIDPRGVEASDIFLYSDNNIMISRKHAPDYQQCQDSNLSCQQDPIVLATTIPRTHSQHESERNHF